MWCMWWWRWSRSSRGRSSSSSRSSGRGGGGGGGGSSSIRSDRSRSRSNGSSRSRSRSRTLADRYPLSVSSSGCCSRATIASCSDLSASTEAPRTTLAALICMASYPCTRRRGRGCHCCVGVGMLKEKRFLLKRVAESCLSASLRLTTGPVFLCCTRSLFLSPMTPTEKSRCSKYSHRPGKGAEGSSRALAFTAERYYVKYSYDGG